MLGQAGLGEPGRFWTGPAPQVSQLGVQESRTRMQGCYNLAKLRRIPWSIIVYYRPSSVKLFGVALFCGRSFSPIDSRSFLFLRLTILRNFQYQRLRVHQHHEP